MKAKQIQALESYFKTENDHWNGFTFEMICEVLQHGQFENPELPLKLFSNAEAIFTENYQSPLQSVQKFTVELDKHKLSASQTFFIYKWVCKYLNGTVYENLDLTLVKELLKSQKEKLRVESQPVKLLTKNIRESLKEMMQKELSELPKTLEGLEPVQRLNLLCKLMPFVLPKVESVNHELGERDKSCFKDSTYKSSLMI